MPCGTPVGATLNPAASARRITSSVAAVVAKSRSRTGCAERQIAHRSADEPGLLARSVERFERSRQRALPQRRQILELSALKARKDSHSIRPGTSTPFSTCAGT